MENETTDVQMDEWIVVQTAGPQYLGRLSRDDSKGWSPDAYVKQLHEILRNGHVIELDVAFEFSTPTVQKQQNGPLTRGAFVMPVGLAGSGVRFYVTPVAVYACADLHDDDKATYREFVEKGYEMMAQFRVGKTRAPVKPAGVIVTG